MNREPVSAEQKFMPTSEELQFALIFAAYAGHTMREQRKHLIARKKLDRTDVTNIDTGLNTAFERAVAEFSGGQASVIGEESSRRVEGSRDEWIIDPVDGTGEYIDDSLPDSERTSCVGISLFRNGEPQLSVVFNPFRDELFYADSTGAFLNGQRLDIRATSMRDQAFATSIPYDYCHWDNAPTDARFFENIVDAPPIGSYSAIYQACMVAKGESAFAIFPGDTVHDIGPASFLVEKAGGVATDIYGNPLDKNNLNGAVYAANAGLHRQVVQVLHSVSK